jgi:hypothetical protein
MPQHRRLSGLIGVDISRFLLPGANRVEIRQSGNSAQASVELVATHYEPGREGGASEADQRQHPAAAAESKGLRITVD